MSKRLPPVSVRRVAASLVWLIGIVLAASYPLGAGWGISAYMASAALIYLTGNAWIVAIPVVLVVGDLYPWTGRLLVAESDLFLLALLSVLLWRSDANQQLFAKQKRFCVYWLLLILAVGVSFARGWHTLPPADLSDTLCIYGSQWNALRVAKGFVWGFILAQLLSGSLSCCVDRLRLFSRGMQVSAFLVAAVVVLERTMAGGVFDFQYLYRATGPFFSMHTGGQHIDAYWALALPFLFFPDAQATWTGWLSKAFLLVVSLYAIIATMSRGLIVLASVVMIIQGFVTVVAAWKVSGRRRSSLYGVAALLLIASAGAVLFWSGPIKSRFAISASDLGIRWKQWVTLCQAADRDWSDKLFGNGLGTVPGIASQAFGYPLRQAELIHLPSGQTALRLRPGKAVYVEQSVDRKSPGPWKLTGQIRCDANIVLNAHVCEKTLFDSFRCLESTFVAPGNSESGEPISWIIDIQKLLNEDKSWLGCPVTFALSVSGRDGTVDVLDIHLVDAQGASLLKNTDFQDGSTRWFFTSDNHAAWRAENMWVQIYLEMGWLGVISVLWLFAATLVPLTVQAIVGRNLTLWVLALSITGFLMIGLFGSLVDTPWLFQLMSAVLAVSQMCSSNWPTLLGGRT